MNKNQFFNIKRFSNYIKSLTLINAKSLLITVTVLFVIFFVLQFLGMPKGDSIRPYKMNEYLGNLTFYLVALGVFIGSGFKPFNHKVNTRNYLAVPASTFEKYVTEFLARIVVGSIGVIVIYWISANLARLAAILTLTSDVNHFEQITPFSYNFLFENFDPSTFLIFTLIVLFIYVALFTIRLFFTKNGFLKTFLSLSAAGAVYFGLTFTIVHKFFKDNGNTGITNWNSEASFISGELFTILICLVGIIGLSIFGYFKLKEKEL